MRYRPFGIPNTPTRPVPKPRCLRGPKRPAVQPAVPGCQTHLSMSLNSSQLISSIHRSRFNRLYRRRVTLTGPALYDERPEHVGRRDCGTSSPNSISKDQNITALKKSKKYKYTSSLSLSAKSGTIQGREPLFLSSSRNVDLGDPFASPGSYVLQIIASSGAFSVSSQQLSFEVGNEAIRVLLRHNCASSQQR